MDPTDLLGGREETHPRSVHEIIKFGELRGRRDSAATLKFSGTGRPGDDRGDKTRNDAKDQDGHVSAVCRPFPKGKVNEKIGTMCNATYAQRFARLCALDCLPDIT